MIVKISSINGFESIAALYLFVVSGLNKPIMSWETLKVKNCILESVPFYMYMSFLYLV